MDITNIKIQSPFLSFWMLHMWNLSGLVEPVLPGTSWKTPKS